MKYYVTMGSGQQVEVHVSRRPAGRLEVRIGDRTIEVDAVDVDGAVNVKAGDRVFDLSVHEQSGQLQFVVDGQRVDAVVESERERVATSASRAGGSMGGEITAPMPGKVVKVLVGVGEMVEPGQAVVVVEAMKMENELCADGGGEVVDVAVTEGQNVDGGTVVLRIGAPGE